MKTRYIKSGSYFEVAITTDRSGRTSIVVHENPHVNNRPIVEVELPAKTGECKDMFTPTVKVQKEIEIEQMKGD